MWVGLGDMVINYSKLSNMVVSVALFVCYQLVGLGVFNVHAFVEKVKGLSYIPSSKEKGGRERDKSKNQNNSKPNYK